MVYDGQVVEEQGRIQSEDMHVRSGYTVTRNYLKYR